MEVSGQLQAMAAFSPGERAPGTHWIGGRVGPHSRSAPRGEEKNLTLPGIEARFIGHTAP
jgi:hypothetical protein